MLAFAVREKDDLAKLAFMNAACEEACPFRNHGLISAEIGSCLDWKATRSSVQVRCALVAVRIDCFFMPQLCCAPKVNEARRCITKTIEHLAEKLQTNGAVDEWFARADDQVREVECIVFVRAGRRVSVVVKPCGTCFVFARPPRGSMHHFWKHCVNGPSTTMQSASTCSERELTSLAILRHRAMVRRLILKVS